MFDMDIKIIRAEKYAVLSSCCGVSGETVLTDSAVILLVAATVGGGNAMGMLLMAILPLLNGVLILPMVKFSLLFGSRSLVIGANILALAGYFTAASALFFNKAGEILLLSGVFLFALCQTGFVAGWFPFLDDFLQAERRALFLGRMRFWHQIAATVLLGAAWLYLGETPSAAELQVVLFGGGIIFAGRLLFIKCIPHFPGKERKNLLWRKGLKKAVHNSKLMYFSFYTFCFNAGTFAVAGIIMMELKNFSRVTEDDIVLVSSVLAAALAAGYAIAPLFERKLGNRRSLVVIHWLGLLAVSGIMIIPVSISAGIICTVCFAALCCFAIAANSVTGGARILSLAQKDNKNMATALWGLFYYGAAGISRLTASLVVALSASGSRIVLCISLAALLTAFLPLQKLRLADEK